MEDLPGNKIFTESEKLRATNLPDFVGFSYNKAKVDKKSRFVHFLREVSQLHLKVFGKHHQQRCINKEKTVLF